MDNARWPLVRKTDRLSADPASAGFPVIPFRQKPDGTLLWDIGAADEVLELTGIPSGDWDADPNPLWLLVAETDLAALRNTLSCTKPEGCATSFQLRHRETGEIRHILEIKRLAPDAASSGLLEGFWIDQTLPVRLQRRVRETSMSEIIAGFAAGYVHELNNAITGITSLTELSLMALEKDHPVHGYLSTVQENIRRTCHIIQDFSRLLQPPGAPALLDLRQATEEAVGLIAHAVPRRIRLETQWDDAALPLMADRQVYSRLLFHLVTNCVGAMPGAGTVRISLVHQESGPDSSMLLGRSPSGPCARLSVSHTGRGLDWEGAARRFELECSTQPGKAGIGVGLALLREFVGAHDGGATLSDGGIEVWLPLEDLEAMGVPERRDREVRLMLFGDRGGASSIGKAMQEAGWNVVYAMREPERALFSGDEAFSGLVLLPGVSLKELEDRVEWLRSHRLAIKIVLVWNPDKEPPTWADKVDLVVDADLSPEQVVAVMRDGFGWQAE